MSECMYSAIFTEESFQNFVNSYKTFWGDDSKIDFWKMNTNVGSGVATHRFKWYDWLYGREVKPNYTGKNVYSMQKLFEHKF